MKVRSLYRSLSASTLGIASAAAAFAQTTTNLTDVTRTWNATTNSYDYTTWKPVLGIPGTGQTGTDGYLYDPVNDSQTGIPQADYVSSTGNAGFFIKSFTVGNESYLAFRVMMDVLPNNSNLYVRIGLDADLNGSVDLFLGPTFSGSTLDGISFIAPGTGANISPNTSSVGPTPIISTSAANSYFSSTTISGATDANYHGWSIQNANADGMISFAVKVSDINTALADPSVTTVTVNKVTTTRYSGAAITADSMLRWVAFTSNQQNTVNQDTYGLPKIANNSSVGDTTFSSFSQIMDSKGRPIPEPATFGLCFGAGLAGFLGLRRRTTRPRAA